MGENRNKVRGSVTFLFLLLLVLGSGLSVTMLKVLGQEAETERITRESRQWSVLFSSFCQAMERQELLPPKSRKNFPKVFFGPGDRSIICSLETGSQPAMRSMLTRWEQAVLTAGDGYRAMSGLRYEMRMPGSDTEENYPPGGIRDLDSGKGNLPVNWGQFADLSWCPLPDARRLKEPLSGFLYYHSTKRKLNWNQGENIRGRGILIVPNHLVIGEGTRISGDFRIFSSGSITIEPGVQLEKVYLFAGKNINISKNSQITGILAANGRVQLDAEAEFIPDRSVLEPFRTPFICQ